MGRWLGGLVGWLAGWLVFALVFTKMANSLTEETKSLLSVAPVPREACT